MSTQNADGEKLPKIKHERVTGTTKVEELDVTDRETGKTYPIKQESFTEKEIDNTHLVKIAPMFYYCTDNNKVLMIPFSIQFSVLEVLKMAGGIATNLENFLKEQREAEKAEGEKGKSE